MTFSASEPGAGSKLALKTTRSLAQTCEEWANDQEEEMGNSDALWLSAEREADDVDARNKGLWAKCFALAEGDAAKTKALYMTERVRQLGGSIANAKPKSKGVAWLKYGLASLLLLVAFFLIIASRMDDGGRSEKNAVIDICWKDHQNPALDEATKRFIAQTCNGLAEEYRAKFGANP